jgi:DNA-directed RNA polymerase specialized sigma24 family protein
MYHIVPGFLQNTDDSARLKRKPVSNGSSTTEDVFLQRFVDELPHVIGALPTRQRQVVCHKFYSEPPLADHEIARLMSVSTDTVPLLVRNALAGMQRIMKEKGLL